MVPKYCMGYTYTKKIIHSVYLNLSRHPVFLFIYICIYKTDNPIPGALKGKGKQGELLGALRTVLLGV